MRDAVAGKIKSVHGVYKKHGCGEFLKSAAYDSDHVNPDSIDKPSMQGNRTGTMKPVL